MSAIAIGLFFGLGFLLAIVGSIWGLVQAFQEDIVWGLLYLFVPFAALVFYAKNWGNLKIRKTFLIQCAGLFMFALAGITAAISPQSPDVQPRFNGQSPSAFPSDFNTSPSPKQSPAPKPKPSP